MFFRNGFARLVLPLIIAAAGYATPVPAASFDCGKASTPDEKVICADRELNDLDVRMAVYLEALGSLQLMGANGAMRDEQREWLVERHKCGADSPCIEAAYRQRVGALREQYLATANERR